MAKKKYTDEYGAATAISLRQKTAYHGIADSQFRSLKTAIALMKRGLYCNILVKTAQKGLPGKLLNKTNLFRGGWVACSADVKGVNHLQKNDIIRCLNITFVI